MIPKPNFQTYRIIIDSLPSGALPDGMSTHINIPELMEKYLIPHAIASFVESELKTRILTPEEREQAWIEDKSSYAKGLTDAWEAARKLIAYEKDGGLRVEAIKEIFGTLICTQIFRDFDVSEVITKIKKYEEEQTEIKVGDEVIIDFKPNETGIITNINSKGMVYVMWKDGSLNRHFITYCKKTGRHFSQVEELLKAMKEKKIMTTPERSHNPK